MAPQFRNGLWCNGNTTDSGSVIQGSSPCRPTSKKRVKNDISIIFHSFCFLLYAHLHSLGQIVAHSDFTLGLKDGYLCLHSEPFQEFYPSVGITFFIQAWTPYRDGIVTRHDGHNASSYPTLARKTYSEGKFP